ncbi:hypothetical protein PVAG01_03444 [Phlyctema vagabunda]|uniref:Uncharacterized protein n=1 Tax=Phlyctema vagabunda TaxID=108571 RepID=A0ABR4PLP9_9HELO
MEVIQTPSLNLSTRYSSPFRFSQQRDVAEEREKDGREEEGQKERSTALRRKEDEIPDATKKRKRGVELDDLILEQTLAQIAAFPNPASPEALQDSINRHFLHLDPPLPPHSGYGDKNLLSFQPNQDQNTNNNTDMKIDITTEAAAAAAAACEAEHEFPTSDFRSSPNMYASGEKGLLDLTIDETSGFEEFESSCTGEMMKRSGSSSEDAGGGGTDAGFLTHDELAKLGLNIAGESPGGETRMDLDTTTSTDLDLDLEFSRRIDEILGVLDDHDMGDEVVGRETGVRDAQEMVENSTKDGDLGEEKLQPKAKEKTKKTKERGGIILKWQKIDRGENPRKKSKT